MNDYLEYSIRPVSSKDSEYIHKIRTTPEVAETILCIPSEREEDTEIYLDRLTVDDHVYVAVLPSEEVIGMCSLNVNRIPRKKHIGKIGLFVSEDFQNKKVGTCLLTKILDLADNWLMLRRLELTVFEDNLKAIGLYEKLGFKKEGLILESAIKNGKYANEWSMSRILS